MAIEASISGQRFTIAGVVDRMVAVFAGQGWLMLGLAMFGVVPKLAYDMVTLSAFGVGVGGEPFAVFSTPAFWISLAILWMGATLASASMTIVSVAAIERRSINLGDSLGLGAARLLPLLLLSIVSAFAVFLGFLLFIVPGVMLMIAWSVAAPAVIIEGEGPIGALERSAFLTKGARWLIFAILLIVGVASVVLGGVSGLSGVLFRSGVVDGLPIVSLIGKTIVSTLTTLFSTAFGAAMYTELKAWKEGGAGGELGEIFA